jgi:hypothetical protein
MRPTGRLEQVQTHKPAEMPSPLPDKRLKVSLLNDASGLVIHIFCQTCARCYAQDMVDTDGNKSIFSAWALCDPLCTPPRCILYITLPRCLRSLSPRLFRSSPFPTLPPTPLSATLLMTPPKPATIKSSVATTRWSTLTPARSTLL